MIDKPLLGKSRGFRGIVEKVPLFSKSDAPLYIFGETGVGKDLLAHEVHARSSRKERPFIVVQCGALPEHLAENELFGHAKGAYTDAPISANGLIAEAEGGTLFLDEVDTLSLGSQAKLLHFLETHEYHSLGSPQMKRANVRIISASNIDLLKGIESRQFRRDLYYRLHILTVSILPLRERIDDIPILAQHFLEKYGRQYRHWPLSLDSAAIDKMTAYLWPGNIRELAGVIERAVLMTTASVISAGEIDIDPSHENGENNTLKGVKQKAVAHIEREYLIRFLTLYCGNVSQSAEAAGIKRQAFQQLLKKHHIDRKDYKTAGLSLVAQTD